MTTKQQQVSALIDFDTSIFAEHYQQGLRRFLFEQHECAGPLSVSTGQLRPDVTTLVAIRDQNAARGYRAGREWFFFDAEPHERRYTENRLIERLRESVLEMAHWQDCDSTWFFSIGCLLGELSGQLFPMNDQEQKEYIRQYQCLGE